MNQTNQMNQMNGHRAAASTLDRNLEGTPQKPHPDAAKRTIHIICADAALASEYHNELSHTQLAPCAVCATIDEARESFGRARPLVTLLDESAVPLAASFEPAVASLIEEAPVVVVASPDRRWDLTFLITSGAADFVPRSGSFVATAAARVEQRVRLGSPDADQLAVSLEDFASGFGEILRHELNNQLTGVLGNAELLLNRRDRLSPDAAERLETIRQLAMRLRETVRRLSHAWDLWHRNAQLQQPQLPRHPPESLSPDQLLQHELRPTVASRPEPLRPQPRLNNVTTLSTNSAARRSATTPASDPEIQLQRTGPVLRTPETPIDAAIARWDKTWRNRKE